MPNLDAIDESFFYTVPSNSNETQAATDYGICEYLKHEKKRISSKFLDPDLFSLTTATEDVVPLVNQQPQDEQTWFPPPQGTVLSMVQLA